MRASRPRTKGPPQRFALDRLETRTLLTGIYNVSISFGVDPAPFEVTSGFQTTAHFTIANGAFQPEAKALIPTGTVTMSWYGGGFLGSGTLVNQQVDIPLVLNQADSGTPITTGRFAGEHILNYTYSGDANFAPFTLVADTEYQLLQQGVGAAFFLVHFNDPTHTVNFVHSPGLTQVNTPINPPITVEILGQDGQRDTTATDSVTLSLNTTTGHLGGTTTVKAVDGLATFSDLTVDAAGTYQLVATIAGTGGAQVSSSSFTVTDGQLKFVPGAGGGGGGGGGAIQNGIAGDAIPPVLVMLQDSLGNTLASDNSTLVTLAPVGGANVPISGNTATLVNGVATFDHLVIGTPGTYQLQASAMPYHAATSPQFTLDGLKLVVQSQPKNTGANSDIPLAIMLVDSQGNVDTNANTSLQLTLNTLAGGANASLTGTTLVQFVNGVATFSPGNAPMITAAGTYTLTATEEELAGNTFVPTQRSSPVTSARFSISGLHLVFTKQPGTVNADAPLAFTVTVRNAKNKIVTTADAGHLVLSLTPKGPGAAGNTAQLSAYTNPGFVQGVDAFGPGTSPFIRVPGKYTITSTYVDNHDGPVPGVLPAVSRQFTVASYRLKFVKQPANSPASSPLHFTIEIVDSKGKIDTTHDTAKIQIVTAPASSATFTPIPFINGIVTFDSSNGIFQIPTPGKYKLVASVLDTADAPMPEIAAATSRSFKII